MTLEQMETTTNQAPGEECGTAGNLLSWEDSEWTLSSKAKLAYRLAKLYTGYMALGYIARHTWLYSHWLFSHIYMAI